MAKLLIAILLVAAQGAAGQTMISRGFSMAGGRFSTFMSSKTVYAGSDGEMHQKTHEVHHDLDHNAAGKVETTKEEWCRDGNCKGHISMVAGPSRFQRIRVGLREMLQRVHVSLTETRYQQPAPQPPQPPQVRVVFLGPRVSEVSQVAPPMYKSATEISIVPCMAMTLIVLSGLYSTVLLCKRFFPGSEARELTGLAEPFAPAEELAAPPKKKAEKKKQEKEEQAAAVSAAASKLMGSVYANVEAKMQAKEKEAASAYLERVYERATA